VEIEELIRNVALEQKLYKEQLKGISEFQAQRKSKPEYWSFLEITEHLFSLW